MAIQSVTSNISAYANTGTQASQTQQSQQALQAQQAEKRVEKKEEPPRPVVNAQGQPTGTLISVIA